MGVGLWVLTSGLEQACKRSCQVVCPPPSLYNTLSPDTCPFPLLPPQAAPS